MAILSVGDIVMVSIVGSLNNQRTMNTFPYRVSAVTGTPTIQSAANALKNSLTAGGGLVPAYIGCTPSNMLINDLWIQVIRPARFRKEVFAINSAGDSGIAANTSNVAATISRQGELALRRAQGCIHVPLGTTSDAFEDGVLTPSQKALLDTLASKMNLNIITTGTVVTYIPLIGLPPFGNPTVDTYATGTQTTVRVVRRRTVGLGI